MKVFLYERVSTQEQVLYGYSLDAQDALLREWCKSEGHTITGVYRDEGVSGRKPIKRRPALSELLDNISGCDLVIFQKLDRWTRNVQQYYIAQEVLDAHGVAWKAVSEDYETLTASGRFKVNIMLAVAENEADRTGERVKAVLEHKRAIGEMAGGRVPTGYKRKNGVFIDEEAQDGVASFFDTYIETASVQKAIDAAAERGLDLTYRKADCMLTSPIYYGGVDFPAPTYITLEQHELIQSLRSHTTRKIAHNRVFLFSGMIYCAECGGRMYGKSTDAKYGTYLHYFCKNKQCVNSTNVNEKIIERYLVDRLDEKLSEVKIEAEKQKKTAQSSEKKIAALRRKIERTKELYVNDLITLQKCKDDVAELEREIETITVPKRVLDDKAMNELLSSGWRDIYAQSEKDVQRGFWLRLIQRIEVAQGKEIDFYLQ